jgi:hypothetical protein
MVKKKAGPKPDEKLIALVKRTGAWDEGIGFVFLIIATILALAFTGDSSANQLLTIPFIASITTIFVFLYCVVGSAFIITGYYLRSVRGRFTKLALGVSAILSIPTILNIIPIIPASYSIYVLIRSRGKSLSVPLQQKESRSFDIRNYPALGFMGLLVSVICIASFLGVQHTEKLAKKSVESGSSKVTKAECQPSDSTTTSTSCTLHEPQDGFKAIFPSRPEITTKKYKGSYASNGFDNKASLTVKKYAYHYTNEKTGYDYARKDYYVVIIDYGRTLSSLKYEDPLYQQGRLNDGADSIISFCSSADTQEAKQPELLITYQELPAMREEIRNGKSFGDQSCSTDTISILKGPRVYTIHYGSYPSAADATEFNNFLQSFSFTN